MSISYNKVILVGRLTRDPEIRSTVNGSTVANFTLAVDNGYGNNKSTDFINIVGFGKQAEFASNYLKKGLLVLVEGQLRINKWTDRNEVKRESAEVWMSSTTFMETKKSSSQPGDFSGNNVEISVEESYKKNNIKSIDDNFSSNEFPEFDDPFSDLESDLSNDDNL